MFVILVHKPFTSGKTLWIQCQTNFVRFTLQSPGHKQQNICTWLTVFMSGNRTFLVHYRSSGVGTWEITCSEKNGGLPYSSFFSPSLFLFPSLLPSFSSQFHLQFSWIGKLKQNPSGTSGICKCFLVPSLLYAFCWRREGLDRAARKHQWGDWGKKWSQVLSLRNTLMFFLCAPTYLMHC